MNYAKILRAPFLQNTSGRLLLTIALPWIKSFLKKYELYIDRRVSEIGKLSNPLNWHLLLFTISSYYYFTISKKYNTNVIPHTV